MGFGGKHPLGSNPVCASPRLRKPRGRPEPLWDLRVRDVVYQLNCTVRFIKDWPPMEAVR